MITKNLFSNLLFMAVLIFTFVSLKSYAQQQRIISAGANITEIIFSLGAEKSLVAVDLTSRKYAQQANIKQVGYHRQLSAEGLMSLNPTRLIGTEEMGPESTLKLLKASNVEVTKLPSGHTVEALEQRIDAIAAITGTQQKALQLKQQVEQSVKQLKKNVLKNKPKVVFLMLNKDRPANIAGANTSVDEIIKLAGAINPAAKDHVSYKPISYEGIITMQPDYILVSDRAWASFGGKEQILEKLPLLVATPAGEKLQIIAVPSSALIGGLGLQSLTLAKQLNESFLAQQ